MIDEVVLFDFKGFQSRSGLVLALSSLFQWFKQSTWSASALTRSLPLLLRTKGPNNATFSQSAAMCQWPFLLRFSTFPPVFPFLSGIRFYWSPCFAPSAQWRLSQRSWDPFPVSFCKAMRAGNIYGYSYQRSCKPRLLTVWFWHFSLCWFWVMWNICDSIMQQLI